jgi:hypothetical protein
VAMECHRGGGWRKDNGCSGVPPVVPVERQDHAETHERKSVRDGEGSHRTGQLGGTWLHRAAAPVKSTAVRWVGELLLGVVVLHVLLKEQGKG